MRSFTQIAVAGLSLLVVAVGQQTTLSADDLFSENRLDSVFGPPVQTAPTQPGAPQQQAPQQPGVVPQGTTVTPDQFEAFLRAAGFEPNKVAEGLYKVEVPSGQIRFPVLFLMNPNDGSIGIVTLLNNLDENTISPKILLELLKANSTYGPNFFIYTVEQKRIDLVRVLSNSNLQPSDLKRAVDILIEVANKTSDLWLNLNNNGAQPGQPAQPVPTQPTVPSQPAPSTQRPVPTDPPIMNEMAPPTQPAPVAPSKLAPTEPAPSADQNGVIGNWAAVQTNGTVFVLEFAADGTYTLNFKNAKGKVSKTRGRFTLTADSLSLAGDDGKLLAGKFIRVNADSFVFVPSTSGANITFVRVGA